MNRAILVHSGWCTLEGKLDEEALERLNYAIVLLHHGRGDYLAFTAGKGTKASWNPDGTFEDKGRTDDNLCDMMASYALAVDVPQELIATTHHGKDTVGEAYFGRRAIFEKKGTTSVLGVSSRWHAQRINEIYRLFLGNSVQWQVEPVTTTRDNDTNFLLDRYGREQKSTRIMHEQFGHIKQASPLALLDVLCTKHPLYVKDAASLIETFR